MPIIENVYGNTELSEKVASKKNDTLGQDEFLLLLVTQLQNQDPLNPMDSKEFTAQLAQFSSLEQMTRMNTTLNSISESQNGLSYIQAASYIGKNVTAQGNLINLSRGEGDEGEDGVDIKFNIGNNASQIVISIYDEAGELVHKIERGSTDRGAVSVYWNGLKSDGTLAPEGLYGYSVMALDHDGKSVSVETTVTVPVTGVDLRGNVPYLISGERAVPLNSVLEVHAAN